MSPGNAADEDYLPSQFLNTRQRGWSWTRNLLGSGTSFSTRREVSTQVFVAAVSADPFVGKPRLGGGTLDCQCRLLTVVTGVVYHRTGTTSVHHPAERPLACTSGLRPRTGRFSICCRSSGENTEHGISAFIHQAESPSTPAQMNMQLLSLLVGLPQ